MKETHRHITLVAGTLAVSLTTAALAGSHTWDVNEVFSNEDGTIQYIELWEANGTPGETGLSGRDVTSASTGMKFTFPSSLVGPTTNKHILLATQSFADLPGAPVPDHIIAEGFFNPDGDTVSYDIWDDWTFGAIPTDCVNSLSRLEGLGVNTPTNYAGDVGEVNCSGGEEPSPDLDGDGVVGPADLAQLLGSWGKCEGCPADLNGDLTVGPADLALLLGAWGPVR